MTILCFSSRLSKNQAKFQPNSYKVSNSLNHHISLRYHVKKICYMYHQKKQQQYFYKVMIDAARVGT